MKQSILPFHFTKPVNSFIHCSESEHLFYVHSAAAPVNMSKKKKPKPFHCSQCKPNPRYFCSATSLSDHIKDVNDCHDKKKKKQQGK
ncbi:hypothetical protein M0R45_037992 [Rubus argutus]|uniref:C2H2-type domain-containing protein n=1 Tax=Rubus argutus TaxID=59490 RepID=A0AAW1W3R6_RUBAR